MFLKKICLLYRAYLTEIQSIDHDGEDTSEEYLRDSLAWPNYCPDQDAWVA